MAERKRRGKGADGEDAAGEVRDNLDSLDDEVDEAVVEDPAEDTLADADDTEDTDESATRQRRSKRRSGTVVRDSDDAADDDEPVKAGAKPARKATKTAKLDKAGSGKGKSDKSRPAKKAGTGSPRGFGRFIRFIREVASELRKVIWPTRRELVTYAVVVLVFVAVILAIVAGLDYGFARGALYVFGSGNNK